MRKSILSRLKTGVASATAVTVLFGISGVTLATLASAATSYSATSAVNVRSGPGTTYPVVGTLKAGQTVAGAGSATGGWVPVTFGGVKRYVYGSYLKASSSTTTPAPSPTSSTIAGTTKYLTVNANFRSGPSMDFSIISVALKGSRVATTGKVTGDYSQVTIAAKTGWIYTTYLSAAAPTNSTVPKLVASATTTALLALRTAATIGSTSLVNIPANSTVGLTGSHSGSYSQVLYKDKTGWVLSGYLDVAGNASGPVVPKLPVATGKRYAKVNGLNIRTTSAATSAIVDTVPLGTVLLITGRTANSRTEVIYNGALRWAYTAYLSTTAPSASGSTSGGSLGSSSLDRTNEYAKAIVREVRENFPQIKTIYGWRASSAYSSDHPNGRALDIMIPSWSSASGKALGDALAKHLQANHKRLHVHYLIWRQRNWNVERNLDPVAGWRLMPNRGGYTANHFDHVHISVYSTS